METCYSISLKPYPESNMIFLSRFGQVSSSKPYTAFLDLQKSRSTSPREAENLNLALERVVLELWPMQKSEELSESSGTSL